MEENIHKTYRMLHNEGLLPSSPDLGPHKMLDFSGLKKKILWILSCASNFDPFSKTAAACSVGWQGNVM